MQFNLKARDYKLINFLGNGSIKGWFHLEQILLRSFEQIPISDLLFDNIMAKIIYGAFDGAIYSVLDK